MRTMRRRVRTKAADERLEARISRDQKRLFQRAAALKGVTLTDFVVSSAEAAAGRTLEEHDTLRLSLEDRHRFVEALMSPPAPNSALRRAAERYQRRTGR